MVFTMKVILSVLLLPVIASCSVIVHSIEPDGKQLSDAALLTRFKRDGIYKGKYISGDCELKYNLGAGVGGGAAVGTAAGAGVGALAGLN